jgi:nucleotide-binding universal stress UspA family protein
MIVPLGHIAGVPVEETALALAPVWGGAMVVVAVRARSLRRRLRRKR